MPTEDPEWGSFLQAAFLAVLEAADEGLIVFDRDGRCRMIGRRAGEIFGLEPAAYVGRTSAEVLGAFAQACEEPEAFFQAVATDSQRGPGFGGDVDIRRPRPRTVVCRGAAIVREGRAVGRLIVVRDVTRERAAERASKQLQARLAELTPFDPLTGLLNQRRFREELEREHGRSTRAWDSYAVLRLDVDGMGALNEEFGVPVGDQVLEQVASRLKACLREYDVLSRLDGDEFGVLLPGADAIAASAVGERMIKTIVAYSLGLEGDRRVTLSVGCAVWVPPSGESGEDIAHRAGQAVYDARSRGGAQVHVDTAPPSAT
jgi:diguanylate cyclase (GGDEF)-like protein/PAS domain S-box-containing protein